MANLERAGGIERFGTAGAAWVVEPSEPRHPHHAAHAARRDTRPRSACPSVCLWLGDFSAPTRWPGSISALLILAWGLGRGGHPASGRAAPCRPSPTCWRRCARGFFRSARGCPRRMRAIPLRLVYQEVRRAGRRAQGTAGWSAVEAGVRCAAQGAGRSRHGRFSRSTTPAR